MNESLIFLNVYFAGRLFFYDINQPLFAIKPSLEKIRWRILFGLLLLVLINDFYLAFYYFLLYLVITLLDRFIIPKNDKARYFVYAVLLILPFLTLCWQPSLPGKPWLPASFLSLPKAYRILLIFLGYIITLKEGTVLIRLALNNLKTVPTLNDQQQTDKDEYERGKWIGILERTFVYFLVIFDQIGAIALIIALKSLARFNELNKKSFAEYFLIGSFLSLLVAALPAVIVRLLM